VTTVQEALGLADEQSKRLLEQSPGAGTVGLRRGSRGELRLSGGRQEVVTPFPSRLKGVLAHLELALLYPAPRTKRVAAGNGTQVKPGV
jgi:hypothetical protein